VDELARASHHVGVKRHVVDPRSGLAEPACACVACGAAFERGKLTLRRERLPCRCRRGHDVLFGRCAACGEPLALRETCDGRLVAVPDTRATLAELEARERTLAAAAWSKRLDPDD